MSLRKPARSPYWRDELLELEQLLLDPSVRGSPQAVIPLLHPDFVEFGSSGRVYTKGDDGADDDFERLPAS